MSAFTRKYATATRIYVPIIKRGVVDYAVSADWTPAAGDVKVSIDGAAAANIGTLPTAITMGNAAYWDFTISSGETTGKKIVVTVADSATKAVEDQCFLIETYGHASAEYQADLSAANLPAAVQSIAANAITATSIASNAITAAKIATDAITAAKIAADAITDAKVASDVTIASVTGAVGSVTGAVGSVTGNVGGNVNGNVVGSVASVAGNVSGSVASVAGAVGSVTGAVGSVTGNVGGNVAGSVASVTGAVGSVTGGVGGDVSGKVLGGGSGTISGDGVRASSVTGAVGSVTGAVGSVTSGVSISGTLTSLDAMWNKVKAWLGTLAGKTADAVTLAEINATTAGAAFDNTRESLEAIRDQGDAAWTGGGGGGSTTVVVAPVVGTIQFNTITASGTVQAFQYCPLPIGPITLVDGNDDPVDVSAGTVKMICTDTKDASKSFTLTTAEGDGLTVGGADGNQISVDYLPELAGLYERKTFHKPVGGDWQVREFGFWNIVPGPDPRDA